MKKVLTILAVLAVYLFTGCGVVAHLNPEKPTPEEVGRQLNEGDRVIYIPVRDVETFKKNLEKGKGYLFREVENYLVLISKKKVWPELLDNEILVKTEDFWPWRRLRVIDIVTISELGDHPDAYNLGPRGLDVKYILMVDDRY